jgi:hypothetical protein
MNIKKPLLIAGAVATLGVASTAAGVQAVTNTGSDQSGIVDKIAQKFNLNKDEVQKVFDEDRATHEAQHQSRMEERLSQAVKDGKLTEDQKTKILAKLTELKASMESERENFKNMTDEERKTHMEQKRTELETWAKENNIPTDYLHFIGHGGGPGGPGKFRMRMDKPASED